VGFDPRIEPFAATRPDWPLPADHTPATQAPPIAGAQQRAQDAVSDERPKDLHERHGHTSREKDGERAYRSGEAHQRPPLPPQQQGYGARDDTAIQPAGRQERPMRQGRVEMGFEVLINREVPVDRPAGAEDDSDQPERQPETARPARRGVGLVMDDHSAFTLAFSPHSRGARRGVFSGTARDAVQSARSAHAIGRSIEGTARSCNHAPRAARAIA